MAVVTVQRFRKAYPEFKGTAEELIQQKLDHADERINDSVFGDNVSIRATMLLAAHLLSFVEPVSLPQVRSSRCVCRHL